MRITDHLKSEEFDSHDGIRYPTIWYGDRLLPMCNVIEAIRAKSGGKPISITSGYRSAAQNAKVKGASSSQHMQGRAADIKIEGMDPHDVHDMILLMYQHGEIMIGGLGRYPDWTHIDIRPNLGHLARWEGREP